MKITRSVSKTSIPLAYDPFAYSVLQNSPVLWNVLDALPLNLWRLLQMVVSQTYDGTQRFDDPVSSNTVKCCAGVPSVILPTYSTSS